MNNFAQRKQELVARSELYRRAMAGEIHNIQGSVAWIPRTMQVVRWASPVLVMAAPILGILTGKKISARPVDKHHGEPKRKSLLAKILAGIAMYRKVRSVVDTLRPMMAVHNGQSKGRAASVRQA